MKGVLFVDHPLTDYKSSQETTTSACSSRLEGKMKRVRKAAKKEKRRAKDFKKKLKLERKLNTERERRYQAEADLKCAVFLLNVMAQGRQIPLPDLSQGGGGGDNP